MNNGEQRIQLLPWADVTLGLGLRLEMGLRNFSVKPWLLRTITCAVSNEFRKHSADLEWKFGTD